MNQFKKRVLVTGGNGFVGIHCILQLLQQGYTVKTTVRTSAKAEQAKEMLKNAGITSFENLEFVEADLLNDKNWDDAMEGCEYVLHVASPFPMIEPEDENELIIPAREGTLRVLKAAQKNNIKRVVMTSSFAAVGYSISREDYVFTEEDWTDPDTDITPYIKSKTIAEKAAWNFINQTESDTELTVINPVGIAGPVLSGNYSTSIQFVEHIITGMIPFENDFSFGIVDVRDVADLHLKAMLHPDAKGERFLAVADGSMSFIEIAELLDVKPEDYSGTPPKHVHISNQKARTILDWNPRSKEEAILATAESLKKYSDIEQE